LTILHFHIPTPIPESSIIGELYGEAEMIGDPNWLYSTIAQSSAAIVAIIGGFITATILTRRAEKTSLLKELADKKEQLRELEEIHLIPKRKLTEQQRQSMEDNAYAKRDKIASLKYGISNLESRLKAFSYPPNLGWGILVLGYLAVFGILFPVLIIAYEAFFTWAKVSVTASFWLGIIGVFAYIVFQIRTLMR